MKLEYFMMIDSIEEVDLHKGMLRASSIVPEESPVFEGHFPNYPLVPGVLLIETMAQASGILVLHYNHYSHLPLLANIKEGKIRDYVRPTAKLEIEAHIEYNGSGFSMLKAQIRSKNKHVADAKLTMTQINWPFPETKQYMNNLIDRLLVKGKKS